MNTMNKATFTKAIKSSTAVYGAVQMTSDDVTYIKLIKADLLYMLAKSNEDTFIASQYNNTLYVN